MKRPLLDETVWELPMQTPKMSSSEIAPNSLKGIVIGGTALLMLVFLLYFGRLIDLQLIKGAMYVNVANHNRLREFTLFAERGVIFDRKNEILVRNKPAFSLQINTLLCFDSA